MKVRQPVINTFERVGLNQWKDLAERSDIVTVRNWITGVPVETHPLIALAIRWVYETQLDYEQGAMKCRISDFDRIRYWILEADKEAYMTCID